MILSPKQLAQYAKVCQKHGITDLTLDGVSFKIDRKESLQQVTSNVQAHSSPLTPDAPSDDQILFWSSNASGEQA